MDNELLNRLMWIAVTGLFLAGVIFIGVFLFSDNKNNGLLFAAIACNILAGLFNTIRELNKK